MKKNQRSQGEIFGIALFFVIIIIGIIIFGQVKALDQENEKDIITENKFKVISEGALNSILKLSTGCYVERGKDSVQDLINYCLENSFSGTDTPIECFKGSEIVTYNSCEQSIKLLDNSLEGLFNPGEGEEGIGKIPYDLYVNIEKNPNSLLNYEVILEDHGPITNFGDFQYRQSVLTESNYRKAGFKRVSSGLKTWPTAQGNIILELNLYYR